MNSAGTSIALAVATACGAGYAPFAPGTAGSLVGLLLWWLLPPAAGVQAGSIVALFLAGCWSGAAAERHFQKTDPGQVVLDEVVGMLLTLFMIPVGWKGAAAGFVLFRAFDIVKSPPANRLEHLPGGLGIMADDAMSAVYANVALRLCVWAYGHIAV